MADTQVAIIGAGPVGLYAAFYARLRGLDVTVVDSLSSSGGQVAHLYPQKELLDIPGFVSIDGQKLTQQLYQQAAQLSPHFKFNTTVADVRYDEADAQFTLVTDQGELTAQKVILAIGRGAFEPKRLPNDLGAAYEGDGVYYVADDLQKFAGRDVLVAGGGDSAVDQALALEPIANQVYLTHRRDNFRAMAYTLDQLATSNVRMLTPFSISEIERVDGKLVVQLMGADATESVVVDDLIVSYAFRSDAQLVEAWTSHPKIERQHCVVARTMETTVPGLYAVGDIAGYPGKTDLIATGFGEAPLAIHDILMQLAPENAGPLHSSGFTIKDGQIDQLK